MIIVALMTLIFHSILSKMYQGNYSNILNVSISIRENTFWNISSAFDSP